MIAGMTPDLQPSAYFFVSVTDAAMIEALAPKALGSFREAEGLSLVLSVADARAAGLAADLAMRCITLSVYSALDGIGLTAAVAAALADAGIACNMIAAHHHDHVFVPETDAERAVAVLRALSDSAAS
jgi:hypothetical protein